jgi:hypothetical protein
VPTSSGVDLDVRSWSIDRYVHAIHSFQAFVTGSIDFIDPVEAKRYTAQIEHTISNFTTKNCEASHVTSSFSSESSKLPVKYEMPDQSQTIPGLLKASATLQHR